MVDKRNQVCTITVNSSIVYKLKDVLTKSQVLFFYHRECELYFSDRKHLIVSYTSPPT